MTYNEGPVVVGVDGFARSAAADTAAVTLGAWEATRRRVGLELVNGHHAAASRPLVGSDGTLTLDPSALDRGVLDDIAKRTMVAYPGLDVTATAVDGGTAGALVAAAATASLVIIAADARVRYGGLLAGLMSIQVAAHAQMPVIVVPTPTSRTSLATVGKVIVGVDGSTGAADAVAFAFDEAQARGATLHAIHVEEEPPRSGLPPVSPAGSSTRSATTSAGTILGDAIRVWQHMYPAVVIIGEIVHGKGPVLALNTAATAADLIVVGARGAGGFDTLALGSVSDGLVRYARCTVAVVPRAACRPGSQPGT